jgi:DNA invertase Pin-like site-specific DNA recombinase
MTRPPVIRAAIYTRKSTEEGLEQDFNSLDAQREACAAYIASQRHEGWTLVPERFDDGGISGGTLDRPGLQRLLAAIEAGQVKMVVVYKIDRLTRSLADFAKLVERLDAAGASFVSVTQAFNTSTSMGRLTLNVLLSFAQFEREVTAERIRDKIAASKKKGLWMGGTLPLGYDKSSDPRDRSMVVNPDEAAVVRQVFDLYDRLQSIGLVEAETKRLGLVTKLHRYPSGRARGGVPFERGQIHYLLTNPTYRGLIRHGDKVYPGSHPAIIEEAQWTRVQDALRAAKARPRRDEASMPPGPSATPTSALTGKLRDEISDLLTPSHTVANGRRYRYYVSNRLITGGTDPSGWRIPARSLESLISTRIAGHLQALADRHGLLRTADARRAAELSQRVSDLTERLLKDPQGSLATLVLRGSIGPGTIHVDLDPIVLAAELAVTQDELSLDVVSMTMGFALRRRGIETKLIAGEREPLPDPTLIRALAESHQHADARLRKVAAPTASEKRIPPSGSRERRKAWLAFLSPRIQVAILDGRQPVGLSLERILASDLPFGWAEQEQLLGFTKTAGTIPADV